MVRKVMGSQELLRSAGTVTKKLASWLYEQGYVSDDEREIAVDQGTEGARDLLLGDGGGHFQLIEQRRNF